MNKTSAKQTAMIYVKQPENTSVNGRLKYIPSADLFINQKGFPMRLLNLTTEEAQVQRSTRAY